MTDQLYMHGDVLIHKIKGMSISGLKPIGKRIAGQLTEPAFILAEGETTLHTHRIEATNEELELFEAPDGTLFMRVHAPDGVTVKHEEHHDGLIPPGDYRIDQQREFDYGQRSQTFVGD